MMAAEAPQADSPLWRLFGGLSGAHVRIYRLTGGRIGGRMLGGRILLLDHVGRKSARERTHPLLCLPDGENLVIVASKGGVDTHPAWWHNLQASPETSVQFGSEQRRVRAREATRDERERLWPRLVEMYPSYADYQARTQRLIPVVILEPAQPTG
ncbi:MAG: nitroreductase family deazaflavin-dependent oxidoreductase [Solirubrobacterales bacterium]|nr:nitroreductase family deazaflavin-dependent oxidoreductase [Solirubrobacterales bacterium]